MKCSRVFDRLVAASAGAAAAVGIAAPTAAQAVQFVTFQGDVAHTGSVSEPGLNPPLRRAWTHRFPGEMSYPVIAEGRVFVTAYDAPSGENPRGVRLVALSAASGKLLWARDLHAENATLAYGSGRVFVSLWPTDQGGSLRAFAASDGAQLWDRFGGSGGGPPAVDGGALYVTENGLGAYRAADGARLWHTFSNNSDFESPAVSPDAVYAAYSCQKLAVRRSDGAALWRADRVCTSGEGGATPALVDGRLYVRDDLVELQGVVFDAASGTQLGTVPADYAPAFRGGLGVFPDARLRPFQTGHTLIAQSLANGRTRWRFRGDRYLDSAPLIVNRTVYVASAAGELYGLSLGRGKVRWHTHIALPVPAPSENSRVLSALGAGEGLLVVPTVRQLIAFRGARHARRGRAG